MPQLLRQYEIKPKYQEDRQQNAVSETDVILNHYGN